MEGFVEEPALEALVKLGNEFDVPVAFDLGSGALLSTEAHGLPPETTVQEAVAMQFDIGNHWKYGNPAAWIRELGRRVVKLDIKGYSRTKGNWADITEDDLP